VALAHCRSTAHCRGAWKMHRWHVSTGS